MMPKIELPTENDYGDAIDFFNYPNKVFTDEQRIEISKLAYKIMLKRKTKQ